MSNDETTKLLQEIKEPTNISSSTSNYGTSRKDNKENSTKPIENRIILNPNIESKGIVGNIQTVLDETPEPLSQSDDFGGAESEEIENEHICGVSIPSGWKYIIYLSLAVGNFITVSSIISLPFWIWDIGTNSTHEKFSYSSSLVTLYVALAAGIIVIERQLKNIKNQNKKENVKKDQGKEELELKNLGEKIIRKRNI